jgi:ubiquinone/menaquinone biosynthesis C-methylase UbiE
MQQYAQQNAAAAGLEPDQLRLLLGDAEKLPFEDGSFDAVAITLVRMACQQIQCTC